VVDGRFAASAPSVPRVTIRAYLRCAAETNARFSRRAKPWIFRNSGEPAEALKPLPDRTSASARSDARCGSFWRAMPSWAKSNPSEVLPQDGDNLTPPRAGIISWSCLYEP
jgi:hypothetical protein